MIKKIGELPRLFKIPCNLSLVTFDVSNLFKKFGANYLQIAGVTSTSRLSLGKISIYPNNAGY
jgi:hypothetical protein